MHKYGVLKKEKYNTIDTNFDFSHNELMHSLNSLISFSSKRYLISSYQILVLGFQHVKHSVIEILNEHMDAHASSASADEMKYSSHAEHN